jgi:hypothetical protein
MLPAYAEDINKIERYKNRKGVIQMNNKKFRMMGVLAVLLIFGLVSAGCDNGLPGNEDELILNVRLLASGSGISVYFEASLNDYGVPPLQDELTAKSWFDFDNLDFTGSSYTATNAFMIWSWSSSQSGTVTVTIKPEKYAEIRAAVRKQIPGSGYVGYTDQPFTGKVTIDPTPSTATF